MRSLLGLWLFCLQTAVGSCQTQSTVSADSLLQRVAWRLDHLQQLQFDQSRELNYSSEDYHFLSRWQVYYAFRPGDSLTGCSYQIEDSASKQVYNGAEKFELDKRAGTMKLDDHPARSTFGGTAALYNSLITLKNIIPILLADPSIGKKVIDTTVDGVAYYALTITPGKRRVQNLGRAFDKMTTPYNIIYTIRIDRSSLLPVEVMQSNDLNGDFIRTRFNKIRTAVEPPAEQSWFYSSYLPAYKRAIEKKEVSLLAAGSFAPNWKLPGYGDLDSLALTALKGKVVLLEFWIKNCEHCIESVTALDRLADEYKSKSFALVGINCYDSEEEVLGFCQKHDVKYPVLLRGRKVAEEYGVGAFPALVVLDRQGKVLYSGMGYDPEIGLIIRKALE